MVWRLQTKIFLKVRTKSSEKLKKQEEFDDDVKRMERAALEAFKKDLEENPELAAEYKEQIEEAKREREELKERQKEKEEAKKAPKEPPVLWKEAKSPDGYSYFWNIDTNESIWVAPDKYISIEEQEKTEKEDKRKEEMEERKREERKRKLEEEEHIKQQASNVDTQELMSLNFGPQLRQPTKNVFGSWVTLSDTTKEPEPDLPPEPVPLECIPLPGLPTEAPSSEQTDKSSEIDKPKSRFKEKQITSLGGTPGEKVSFKKRKVASGARNVRRRDDDD